MQSHPTETSAAPISDQTKALAAFTRYLRLLHRLSTTDHSSIDAFFSDYLVTGCEIFGVSNGVLMVMEEGELRVRKLHTDGGKGPDRQHSSEVLASRQTSVCWEGEYGRVFQIGAPILVEDERWGVISFWSDQTLAVEVHPQAREVIEMMAKSIGAAVRQRELTDQLAHQAMHDALTGLPNRMLMQSRLQSALESAAAQGAPAAVMFIDLDRFKEINDTLGHSIGDGVLQQIASRLERCMGPGDTLARMGGDEFTAILTNLTDRQDALSRARKLLTELRAPCRVEQYELFVTGSIGISFFPQDAGDASTLLKNADSAMYTAKSRGKNDVYCFDAGMIATARERLSLETQLRRALERDEFEMLFQPQVEMDGRLCSVEVLLSWEHPELGRIPPARFIPIAEETGMILSIGSWVLREACRRMAAWMTEGIRGVAVAVNVSALQFAQPTFVNNVAEVLSSSGLSPNCLELELTESLIMRDVEQSASVLQNLRELGVKIAIDDFGTGYSSLSYLRRLPADDLKIDQSFLRDIQSGKAAALVETIVTLGHALGLVVTAEGVETEEQLALLRRAGCDRVQGHLVGAAMSEEALRPLLLSGKRAW